MSGAVGGEAPVAVTVSSLPVFVHIGISPTELLTAAPAPATLRVGIDSDDGIGELGISAATISLDRSISFERSGLPACRKPGVEDGIEIQSSGESGECPHAVVGRAVANFRFAFPEQVPIEVRARGKIYNGSVRRGVSHLLVELPIGTPLDGVVYLIVPVRPLDEGQFGSEMSISVPQLAGGSGALVELELELNRSFKVDKERRSFVEARCPNGKLALSADLTFDDGTKFEQEAVRACTPRR
ncbi:MAG TPA: hypothetical protein VMH33_08965 [Solirubrobacterales bacterium]|nr:hypothetical protein [Solirubrobacterales bacterium]